MSLKSADFDTIYFLNNFSNGLRITKVNLLLYESLISYGNPALGALSPILVDDMLDGKSNAGI